MDYTGIALVIASISGLILGWKQLQIKSGQDLVIRQNSVLGEQNEIGHKLANSSRSRLEEQLQASNAALFKALGIATKDLPAEIPTDTTATTILPRVPTKEDPKP